ncbi:DNA topoisomerase I [archaeon]|nr:DNA topoisomerase I [archaeon]
MPKKKTSREEKASETFFNANQDAKKTTEKEVERGKSKKEILKITTEKAPSRVTPADEILKKSVTKTTSKFLPSELITIEKQGNIKKKPVKKKYAKKKTAKKRVAKKTAKTTTTKQEPYSIPKILLKKDGYELIITEKPQAALKIASALGNATKRELTRGVPYYEVSRNGKKIIVACAVGHLFTLKQMSPGSNVPTFDIDWVPNFVAKKGDFSKKYYDTLLKLAKNAGSLTVATDFDVEGEVIGANVVRLICNQEDAKRMKFSTLTEKELNNAYENKLPSIEWGQEIAGEARHHLDWYYGINLSRALMNAIKTTGKFKIMSIGRVQGPTLALIVKKEREIQKFVSEPYWQIFITVKSPKVELKYTKDIFEKKELENFKNIIGKKGIAETKAAEQILPPNPPFNLTTLQTEAYNLYGITPANSLKAAQSLYLAGLISYPRTSSQKLPDSIDYKSILNILKIRFLVSKLITKEKPIEGEKTDPAHPSIYPTGNQPPVLSGDEEKVYNLIVKRFLALFCDNAIIDKKRITVTVDNYKFSKNGQEIRKKAWMEFYPTKTKEEHIPTLEGEVTVTDSRTEEKETQPPKRYSQASILSELEKRNLGTKATRAAILDTLYDRGYIREKSIEATPLGISLINTLEKYSPIIIDEDLTKELQDKMDTMAESHIKPTKEKEEIIEQAKKTIIKIANDFEKNENKIGNELVNAQEKQREIEREENKLIACPNCKKGDLAITYSPKNKKFFIACNAYPNCKTTYSLPPYGTIKKVGKDCEKCGFPLLMSLSKGKKPWIFCFNTDCETNRERREAYEQKLAKQAENETNE